MTSGAGSAGPLRRRAGRRDPAAASANRPARIARPVSARSGRPCLPPPQPWSDARSRTELARSATSGAGIWIKAAASRPAPRSKLSAVSCLAPQATPPIKSTTGRASATVRQFPNTPYDQPEQHRHRGGEDARAGVELTPIGLVRRDRSALGRHRAAVPAASDSTSAGATDRDCPATTGWAAGRAAIAGPASSVKRQHNQRQIDWLAADGEQRHQQRDERRHPCPHAETVATAAAPE